jgi:hypothetical protein
MTTSDPRDKPARPADEPRSIESVPPDDAGADDEVFNPAGLSRSDEDEAAVRRRESGERSR